jgi:hypothetical protein
MRQVPRLLAGSGWIAVRRCWQVRVDRGLPLLAGVSDEAGSTTAGRSGWIAVCRCWQVRVDRGLPLLAGVVLRQVPRLRGIAGVGGLGFRVMVTP